MLSVAIIIRTFNEEKWIRHCLEACEAQKTNLQVKVVIIDTGSTDLTLDIIREKGYKYLEYKNKYIPGKVLNQAIKSIDCDFYIILSSHCIPTDNDWIETLTKPLLKDDKIAGVFEDKFLYQILKILIREIFLMTFGAKVDINTRILSFIMQIVL